MPRKIQELKKSTCKTSLIASFRRIITFKLRNTFPPSIRFWGMWYAVIRYGSQYDVFVLAARAYKHTTLPRTIRIANAFAYSWYRQARSRRALDYEPSLLQTPSGTPWGFVMARCTCTTELTPKAKHVVQLFVYVSSRCVHCCNFIAAVWLDIENCTLNLGVIAQNLPIAYLE